MTKFKIREGTADDVPSIVACVQAAYQHYIERIGKPPGPILDDYEAVVRDHHVHVAQSILKDDFAGLLVLIEKEADLLLDNIAVHPDFQGMKLGKLLMQKAEEEAQILGYDSIILYTHELMTENQMIYRKIGYLETHRVNEKGFQRVYMRKQLA